MQNTRWTLVYTLTALVMALVLAGLLMAVPVKDGARDWFAPLIRNGWMAWTFPVALFFYAVAGLLTIFTILAIRFPETPKRGFSASRPPVATACSFRFWARPSFALAGSSSSARL